MQGKRLKSVNFAMSIKKIGNKVTQETQKVVQDTLISYLKDLSTGIIANSPVSTESYGGIGVPAKFATNSYVSNTFIYTDNTTPGTFELLEDEYAGYNGGVDVPKTIGGLSEVIAQCKDFSKFPRKITIENRTKSPYTGFPYGLLVERYGWSSGVPPYSPFKKALDLVNSNPKYSNFISKK